VVQERAKTGVANASKKVSELDMSNLLPYAPQYQVATGGYVPFNEALKGPVDIYRKLYLIVLSNHKIL